MQLVGGVRENLQMGGKIKPQTYRHTFPLQPAPLGLVSSGLGEEGGTDPLDFDKWSRLRSSTPPTGPLYALFVYSSTILLGASGGNFLPARGGAGPVLSSRPRRGLQLTLSSPLQSPGLSLALR